MQQLFKCFFISLLFIANASFAQRKEDDLIKWNATQKLSWSDYKASPNTESDAAASTTTYLGIEYKISSSNFKFKIESTFSKKHSWGLHKTEYILAHEQGHFDIAEIFARKLNKEMKAYQFKKQTYQKDLDKIYNDILDAKEEMQNSYDEETNHSINKEKQKQWFSRIALLLKEYEMHADY
jgi:predicted secreted Zn-dependent protease